MLSKELVAASAKPLVLSILAEGENYGYAIIQRVHALSGGQIAWTDGMMYPVLHRLERQKLIASEWRKAATGRKRKYYRLTAKGRQALAVERQHWMIVHSTLDTPEMWGYVQFSAIDAGSGEEEFVSR